MREMLVVCAIVLCSCAYVPEKAASIEDYCASAALESNRYVGAKDAGISRSELKAQIGFALGGVYPAREIRAMHAVVDMVYDGMPRAEIERTCIVRRTNNTWFI